ncbi:MAG: hypothetical protein RR701_19320, partial [Comamonas sp.]
MSTNHPRHEEAYTPSCCGGSACAPQAQAQPAAHADHGDHAHAHDHTHAEEASDPHAGHDHGVLPGWPRIAAALVLSVLAEAAHWGLALHPALEYAGMALAVVAIGLSGLGVYRAGVKDLLRLKLG